MLYELILLGTTITVFLLTGCSSKKAAPSVAKSPAVNTPKTPSVSMTPVSATDMETNETGATTKGDGTTTNGGGTTTNGGGDTTKGDGETTKGDGKDNETKDDEAKDDKNKDKKEDKKKPKDDEKKEDDGEKKKESDEKDENKKDDDKQSKQKKETFICPDPSELRFETATTSQKKLRLKNLTSKKLMFKIKSTTTNTYLINPVFGKIEPNNFADVMITHRPSAKREDKLVIITTEMLGKELEMAKTFKQIKITGADVNVKLVAA